MAPPDLSRVNFLIAPGHFPRKQPYVLVEDAGFLPDTLAFIRAFAPDAPYHGTVRPDVPLRDVPMGADLVVSSDHWYDAVAGLLGRGVPAGRITVLLNTFNDGLGYLEVGRECPEHMAELADPAVPVARKVKLMRAHLLRYATAKRFEGDTPVWDPEHYFTPYQGLVRENAAAVHDITAALADAESREAYQMVLFGRPEELLNYYLSRVFYHQQYVDEVARLRPGDVIVNAGIGSGWDVPYLVAANRGVGRHILLDPLPESTVPDGPCGRLVRRLGMEYYACGLWDQTDELTFQADESGMLHTGGGPGGLGADAPVHKASLRRLDDLVREWKLDRLDLLKMDIEGADFRALAGMKDTLTRFRPRIATCLYHAPDHMWKIPQLLMEWLPNYRFYVRHYSYTRFECLMYAIPEERAAAAPAPGEADRFAAAGLDYSLVAGTWDRVIPAEPFRKAASRLGHEPRQVVRAAEAALDAAYPKAGLGDPAPTVVIDVGRDRFLGTGWGAGCESRTQAWRWVGPDGESSVYVTLDPAKEHVCRFLYHHAESQAGFDQASLEVNGVPAVGREIGKHGDYYYVQWRIPAAAPARTRGRCRLRFSTAPGPRQTSIAAVHCWQAA